MTAKEKILNQTGKVMLVDLLPADLKMMGTEHNDSGPSSGMPHSSFIWRMKQLCTLAQYSFVAWIHSWYWPGTALVVPKTWHI
jgi:hypothetical protein